MADSAMELTAARQFELEKMKRLIDNTSDLDVLRGLAKQLHRALEVQKAATLWAIKQSDPRRATFGD